MLDTGEGKGEGSEGREGDEIGDEIEIDIGDILVVGWLGVLWVGGFFGKEDGRWEMEFFFGWIRGRVRGDW